MSQVVIENPIINSPFDEPTRHFRFTDEGITNEIIAGRRASSYFVPIARPKKKGGTQLSFDTEWTEDRIEENRLVNDIRRRVGRPPRASLRRSRLVPLDLSGRRSLLDGRLQGGRPGGREAARRRSWSARSPTHGATRRPIHCSARAPRRRPQPSVVSPRTS